MVKFSSKVFLMTINNTNEKKKRQLPWFVCYVLLPEMVEPDNTNLVLNECTRVTFVVKLSYPY